MKRFAVAAAAALLLAGCGDTTNIDKLIDNNSKAENKSVTLNSTDEAVASEAEKQAAEYWSQAEKVTVPPQQDVDLAKLDLSDGDIDIDLTKLSGNMCYAQVSDMINNPSKYLGKKVRARGNFAYTTDESTKQEYFAVFIADAAACCQQGMEFTLTGSHKYPDDYPNIGDFIIIEGTYNQYVENGWTYSQLKDSTMQIV